MTIADYLKYKPAIQARSEEIATQWYRAIAKHSYLPIPSVQMRDIFTQLVSRSVDILFSDPFDQEGAQVIGATVGELQYVEHRTLGDTQRLFAIEFMAGLPADAISVLHQPLSELLAEMSIGFFLSTKKNLIEIQEKLRASVKTKLTASETRFWTLAELAPVAIFIYRDEKLLYTNNYFKLLSGFSEAEISQMIVWDIIHPDHREIIKAREVAVRNGGVLPVRYEVKAQKKDKTDFWVELSFSEIQFNGNPAILGTAFDITSRVNEAEERDKLLRNTQLEIQERIKIEKQLLKFQERNLALLEAMPDLMFRLDADGRFLDFHANDTQKLFASPDEFLGHCISDVMPAPVAKKIKNGISQVFETGKSVSLNYDLVLEDGSISTFEARLILSGDSEIVSTIRDITAQKEVEQHAIKAERLAALGQLAATLAHEMNNPLQAILSNLDLISDFELSKSEIDTQIDIINHEVNRLIDISQRMLNFASVKPELNQPLSPTEVMRYTLDLIQKQIKQNHIHIRFIVPKNTALVMTGFNQLHQVFLNILFNAFEAVQSQDKDSRLIDIVISSTKTKIKISIANNGKHIPKEIMAHLFEPFVTTKSDNTGLGLWTSYTFVKQQGGDVNVKNIFGKNPGVIFTISLPIYQPNKG